MKVFSGLATLLLLIFLLLGGYIASEYVDTVSPAWQAEAAAKVSMNVKDYDDRLRNDAERRAWFTEFYRVLFTGMAVIAGAGAAVYYWTVYDRRKESWARAVDGTFALQSFNNGQVRWQVDPNKQLTGTTGFQQATGLLGEFNSAAGPDRQLVNNLAIQKTRTASAVTSGEGFKYAATGKYLGGAYDRNDMPALPMLDDDEADPVTTWQVLTAQDAFAQSNANRWVLGQSPINGELFELNPKEAAHYGIVGATGTGKTAYTALLLMAYALKNKYRVVILDGKGGADWSKYSQIAEYYALDYSNVGGIIAQMLSEYDKRQAILNQYGVNSIWELPSGAKPRPTLFIVDEFGAVMDSLKAANKTAYKAVEIDLGNLLRLSRGAGLYVVLCDQNPSKWPGTVRANMPMNLAYRLGGGIGNAVQEYNLDRLERVGQFQVSNEVYNAFKTFEVIDQLLPDGTYKKPLALLTVDGDSTGDNNEGGDRGPNPTPHPRTGDGGDKPGLGGATGEHHPQVRTGVGGDKAVTAPVLTGKPITAQHRQQVRNIYAMTGSKNETMRLVWGGKNTRRANWLNEVLAGGEVQQ
jgi:hypothetical protein